MQDVDPLVARRPARRRSRPVPSGLPSSATSTCAVGTAANSRSRISGEVLPLVIGRDDHQHPVAVRLVEFEVRRRVAFGLTVSRSSTGLTGSWVRRRRWLSCGRVGRLGRARMRSTPDRAGDADDRRTTSQRRGVARASSHSSGATEHRTGVVAVISGTVGVRYPGVNSGMVDSTVPSGRSTVDTPLVEEINTLAAVFDRPHPAHRLLLVGLVGVAEGRVVGLHHQHLGAAVARRRGPARRRRPRSR